MDFETKKYLFFPLVDQSFANENTRYPNNWTSEICMNDVIMKKKSEKN
jgi:hypothetical protein